MNKEISTGLIVKSIFKNLKMIVFVLIITIVLASLFYFFSPRYYTAKSVILPVPGEAGGLAGLLGSSGLSMLSQSGGANIMFVALRSRTLAEDVLKKFNNYELMLAGLVFRNLNC